MPLLSKQYSHVNLPLMQTTQPTELYNRLQQVLEQGDDQAARKFVSDHINEFPEDVQQQIALALFEEALDQQAVARATRDSVQKQGLEAAAMLDSDLRNLEDQLKVNELKANLKE